MAFPESSSACGERNDLAASVRGRFTPRRGRRAATCGFTLVELMVVVVIIGILAAIAVPQVVERMRERRAGQSAQTVAMMFRNARMRALGRGFAVVVTYSTGNGFQVREALSPTGGGASCAPGLPITCTNPTWNVATASRLVDSFNPDTFGGSGYGGITTTVSDSTTGTVASNFTMCFSPRGRSYSRTTAAGTFTPLTDMMDVAVARAGSSTVRHVSVLPNGMARLAL